MRAAWEEQAEAQALAVSVDKPAKPKKRILKQRSLNAYLFGQFKMAKVAGPDLKKCVCVWWDILATKAWVNNKFSFAPLETHEMTEFSDAQD